MKFPQGLNRGKSLLSNEHSISLEMLLTDSEFFLDVIRAGLMKDYFCILALLITVVFTHSSFAAPLLSVSDLGISGLNRFWLVEVAPDPLLFAGGSEGFGGSLTVELAFEVTDGNVIGASRNATDWPADNPGHNPFTASVTFGVVVDFAGDTVFAALGSEFFTTGAPVEVLTIETT
jgi:hypothetical protein